MIQSNFSVYPSIELLPSAEQPGEADAYRAWLVRREAARKEISRLSRREHQVVELVAQGLANKGIAQELAISVKTIEKHRANAARKLGVNSTADLVRISVLADHQRQPLVNRLRTEVAPAANAEPVLSEH